MRDATMIRGGNYAYPGHLKKITLRSETYQFPLNESFFMGAAMATMATTARLRYFVGDRGDAASGIRHGRR